MNKFILQHITLSQHNTPVSCKTVTTFESEDQLSKDLFISTYISSFNVDQEDVEDVTEMLDNDVVVSLENNTIIQDEEEGLIILTQLDS